MHRGQLRGRPEACVCEIQSLNKTGANNGASNKLAEVGILFSLLVTVKHNKY